MKIARTRNTIKNTIWGSINKIATMLGHFVVQTVIIRVLGMEYNGLTGLFSSILYVLNLAELGIGTAIVFSMYKAVATDDKEQICSLLNFYKKVYYAIGSIALGVGLTAMLFLKAICPEELPGGLNLYLIYLVCLSNVVVSYTFFSYQQAVLNALQRTSIVDKYRSIISSLVYAFQIVMLILFKNYYLYVITLPIQTLIINYFLYRKARILYPELIPKGQIDKDKKRQIINKTKALFFYRIGGTVLHAVDSIVISATLGLHLLGQYNSYYYIINALSGFVTIFFSSMTAGIGNSMATETVKKNYHDFTIVFFLHRWVIGWMAITLLCLYEPFMEIWIGREEMFPFGVVVCLVIWFYFMQIGSVVNVYKDGGGLWEYDKWRPIVASAVNLILNLSFVHLIGIYAIIASTIISVIVIILPWSTYVAFKHYFVKGMKEYIAMMLQGILSSSLIGILTYYLCGLIALGNIWGIIIKFIICAIVPNLLFFAVFSHTKCYMPTKKWILSKLKISVKS